MNKSVFTYNPNLQARNWDILTYCERDYILEVLKRHNDVIRAYAFIYHDKFTQYELEEKAKKEKVDVSEVSKHPHYHVVIRLTRPIKLGTIKNWFFCTDAEGNKINTRLKQCDYKIAFEYLTHKNDPLKYQYPKSDIISNNLPAFKSSKNPDDNISIDIVDEMLCGTPIYDILQKYGNHFAFRINQYKLLFDLIYYGNEFVEIRNKNGLLNLKRSFSEVNHKLLSVENIEFFNKKE